MLDIKFIRENQEVVKEAIRKKRLTLNLDDLVNVDNRRLELLGEVEAARARQNEASALLGGQIEEADRRRLIGEMGDLKRKLQDKEDKLKSLMVEWKKLMLAVPNIPHVSVPDGDSDADNVEIRAVGDKPEFSFAPKNHWELLSALGWADFSRGAKVAGFRGYFLTGEAARWSLALWQFSFDCFIRQGFIPMFAPSLLRPEPFLGTGYLPQGADDLYKTQDGDYLSGTAEVGTMGYLMDEVVPRAELPKKFVSFSPCFRREAGSHGKDTKGLIRVHEFFKVEQVMIVEANHEASTLAHEELLAAAEELMRALGLPYRVVINASGDLGLGQVKKYDIEVWLPGEKRYCETHSISYFNDFQTRRLNIRYIDESDKKRFAHSLNGTGLATPRLIAALAENYQQSDGRIKAPAALAPYLNLIDRQ